MMSKPRKRKVKIRLPSGEMKVMSLASKLWSGVYDIKPVEVMEILGQVSDTAIRSVRREMQRVITNNKKFENANVIVNQLPSKSTELKLEIFLNRASGWLEREKFQAFKNAINEMKTKKKNWNDRGKYWSILLTSTRYGSIGEKFKVFLDLIENAELTYHYKEVTGNHPKTSKHAATFVGRYRDDDLKLGEEGS